LKLWLVLLEDALVVVLPELLRGILAGNSLKDFEMSALFALVLLGLLTLLAAWMLILELGQIIHVLVDHNV